MAEVKQSSGLATADEYAGRILVVLTAAGVYVPPTKLDGLRRDLTRLVEGACSLARKEERAAQVRAARFRGCS